MIKQKFKAFTLAEVLITLGIIGIVAAMTIPTLVANTNSSKFRAQAKKSLSTLNQATRMAQAQYDFNWAGIGACGADPAKENPASTQTVCSLINGTLTGYTYMGKLGDLKLPNGDSYWDSIEGVGWRGTLMGGYTELEVYYMADGVLLAINGRGTDNTASSKTCHKELGQTLDDYFYTGGNAPCQGFIDVNGLAKPNFEVLCEDPEETVPVGNQGRTTCKVPSKNMGDIFPFVYYDGTVEFLTTAAQSVVKSSK